MARENSQTVVQIEVFRKTMPGLLKAALSAPALLCALSLLLSCATRPPVIGPSPEGEFAALDGGGMAYFAVDIPAARPILDLALFEGIRGGEAAEILDMTDTATGAVYAVANEEDTPAGSPRREAVPAERRYLIAAQGKYPAGRAGFAFTFSREWKKLKSPAGKRYWYSRREDLALVLETRSALVSNADPYPRSAAVEIPGAFREFRENAALAGWVRSPSVPLNRFMAQLNIPIQIPADLLVFAVYPAKEGEFMEGEEEKRLYTARVRLETQSPSQAKALASMFSMMRLFAADTELPPAIAAFLANTPAVDGAALILSTGVLEPEAIALLFNMFSVYSR
ncbi:MAG: hypothetical protein LBK05_02380 [Treponema sp.]|jgi:hypothetical protein|nr:hypothetical protein [Treponema sp.]